MGKKLTAETCLKMSQTHKGTKKPWNKANKGSWETGHIPWNKGLTGWNKGHVVSQETKEKLRLSNLKSNPKSKINELIRKSQRFKLWRQAVFERDDYTCQECGARSRKGKRLRIHPHHLWELAKIIKTLNILTMKQAHTIPILWDIDNGKTLCSTCHQKHHKNIFTGMKAEKVAGK